MPDPDEPANDNGLSDDEAHYLGLLDTLPAIPVASIAAAVVKLDDGRRKAPPPPGEGQQRG